MEEKGGPLRSMKASEMASDVGLILMLASGGTLPSA